MARAYCSPARSSKRRMRSIVASHSFATAGSGRGCSAIPTDTTNTGRSSIPATRMSTVAHVRRALPVLLALLVLAAPAGALADTPPADRPAWPLQPQGRWVTDAQGRVVIVHGVDVVARAAPWLPGAAGFGDDDARLLARAGFSAVRLGVVPAAVMPRPDAVDARLPRARRRDRAAAGPSRAAHAHRPAPGPVEPALSRLRPARLDDPRRRPAGDAARAFAPRLRHEPRARPRVPELLGQPAGRRRRRSPATAGPRSPARSRVRSPASARSSATTS